jgi:PKD repeat protein
MKILVDGVTQPFSKDGSPTWSTWAMGESLNYKYSGAVPGMVQIIYTGGSGSTILVSSNFAVSPSGSPTTATTTATTTTITTTTTIPVPTVGANFSGSPTTGYLPLAVQFTDQSTGPVTRWNWNFGDGNISSVQNPQYTYPNAGNYTVTLTVKNATSGATSTATKTNYIQVLSFAQFVTNQSVFVYGSKLYFQGSQVIGPGSTIILEGTSVATGDFNGGAKIAVTTIYIDGDVTLNGGSASWGSSTTPGAIYINGNLNLNGGTRDIYGNVSVAKNLYLENCYIHGNMYVNGDLTLAYGVPSIDSNKYIYYTGTLTYPTGYDTTFLSRCIKVTSVPGFTLPDLPTPSVKSDAWYTAQGYVSGGALTSNTKIVADSYTSYSWGSTASNVIIVARNGDITLSQGNYGDVTGVLFAPKGKVTFNGGNFNGVVIARDGFYVTSGATVVTFQNLNQYISDPNNYPF